MHARNVSRSTRSGNTERSSRRGGNRRHGMNMHEHRIGCADLYADTLKGRYVASRSCARQSSRNVSSITTSVVKAATLARRRTDGGISLLGHLLARMRVEEKKGKGGNYRCVKKWKEELAVHSTSGRPTLTGARSMEHANTHEDILSWLDKLLLP